MTQYDAWETRSAEERAASLAECLPALVASAQALPGQAERLAGVATRDIIDRSALAALPVLRKADLAAAQADRPPLGGLARLDASGFAQLFQSPGPIYEPGMATRDWWRLGRFLHACGIGAGDVVQNCFGYHLTPAGHMFESAARAVGATVIPAGTGQTDLQVAAAAHLGATAYAGTPDFLSVLLEKADAAGVALGIHKAAVSGGALFPEMRERYQARGIACLQCYATADLGLIAYETGAGDGMVVDEGVVVEIVRPGTGDSVPDGEVGEVVVTALNPDYPLIRFATGDLSKILPGPSACGRTNMRLAGWMGRADQTAKVRGMFVRPEQVAAFVARHAGVSRARMVIVREQDSDAFTLLVEGDAPLEPLTADLAEVFKLRGSVERAAPGSLPNDGKVIEDRREAPQS